MTGIAYKTWSAHEQALRNGVERGDDSLLTDLPADYAANAVWRGQPFQIVQVKGIPNQQHHGYLWLGARVRNRCPQGAVGSRLLPTEISNGDVYGLRLEVGAFCPRGRRLVGHSGSQMRPVNGYQAAPREGVIGKYKDP